MKTFCLKAAVWMPALQHGFFHGFQGNICSNAWSTSTPPFSLALVFTGLFLTLFFLHLSPLCTVSLFLKYVSFRHHDFCCWAQVCPAVCPLDLAGTSCDQDKAGPGLFSEPPCSPPLPTPCHLNPIHQIKPKDNPIITDN